MKRIFLLLLIVCLAGMTACQKKKEYDEAAKSQKLTVVTTLFPLYDFTRAIAGDKAEVSMLLPPGVEPHSFEPTPNDVVRVSKADVVIYTNEYLEPWAVKLLRTVATKPVIVDSSAGVKLHKASGEAEEEHEGEHDHHEAGSVDPHIWLDFSTAQTMVANIAKGLSAKDPANKDYYASQAAKYQEQLKKLDEEYKAGLANCGKKTILQGGHFAFGYLARRYGFAYQSAQALNPDAEPTPEKLARLIRVMKQEGLKYVYSEELLSPSLSEMIAKETGAKVLTLHAAHNISKDDLARGVSFIAVMRQNLANLRLGLECR